MTPEVWNQVKAQFEQAIQLPADKRAAFLDTASIELEPAAAEELRALVHNYVEDEDFIGEAALASPIHQAALTDVLTPPLADALFANRYKVGERLGSGGFGDVYRAQDTALMEKEVVLKVLRTTEADPIWLRERFRQEVAALARINHPGVVGVLDYGEAEGDRPYLVMPYVPGLTLRERIARGPLDPRQLAPLIRQIGDALSAAHEQGVTHRDLKPENILVRALDNGTEQAVIIDFGIAVATKGGAVCRTTRVVGSMDYIAPEQLMGRPSTASDIYSMGVIAYEACTGQRPFQPESPFELPALQARGPQKASQLRPELDGNMDRILTQCLAYEESARPASAREAATALADALVQNGSHTALRGWSRRTVLGLFAGTGTLLAVLYSVAMPTAAPERLRYRLMIRRSTSSGGSEELAVAGRVFTAEDELRIFVKPAKGGWLYLVNESSRGEEGFTLLFPYPSANRGSAFLAPGTAVRLPERAQDSIRFDETSGTERLWIVWSEAAIPALDALLAFANPGDLGRVRDAGAAAEVRRVLTQKVPQDIQVSLDPQSGETLLSGASPVLVHLLLLDHR